MTTAAQAIAALGRIQRVVDELGQLPRKLAVAAAPDITAMLHQQFVDGKDPYGRAWKPLAKSTVAKGRRNPPLYGPTRKLADGTMAKPMTGGRIGLTLIVGAPYGIFHQQGRGRPPRREILPTRGMPAAWRRALDTQAKLLARRAAGAP
jgi:hypothetical protein